MISDSPAVYLVPQDIEIRGLIGAKVRAIDHTAGILACSGYKRLQIGGIISDGRKCVVTISLLPGGSDASYGSLGVFRYIEYCRQGGRGTF